MAEYAHFFDFFTKLLYGTHLALAFSGVTYQKQKQKYLVLILTVSVLQNLSLLCLGEEITIKIYPLLIHIPIILYLNQRLKIPLFHCVLSLMFAFQLLTCRAWSGIFAANILGNTQFLIDIFSALLSFPLAFFFGKFLAPPIVRLKDDPKIMAMISIAPVSYYISSYLFNIYGFLAANDSEQLLRFMEAWLVLAFVMYSLFSFYLFEEKQKIETERAVFKNMQHHAEIELKQLHSQHEIEQMHQHDLRHHGNYLLSVLPANTDREIINYIKTALITPNEDNVILSNNESLNLILNFYRKKAIDEGVAFSIYAEAEDYSGISIIDLCSLLSNGLENAFSATTVLEKEKRCIYLKIKSKGETMSIDMRNSFAKEPIFVDNLPYTAQENHGFGIKSMSRICKKYNGITRFCVIDNQFCFQTVLKNTTKQCDDC